MSLNQDRVEIAQLQLQINKYDKSAVYPFYIPKLVIHKGSNIVAPPPVPITTINIANKDKGQIAVNSYASYGIFYIMLPKSIALTYPKKYIPVGTEFIVTFIGGDITKPMITGRYEVDA